MSRSRGHAMMLVMAMLIAVSALLAVAWARVQAENESAPRDDQRIQALWLARSAARSGFTGSLQVDLGRAKARLTSRSAQGPSGRSIIAEVAVPAGIARVEAVLGKDGRPASWRESFERAR